MDSVHWMETQILSCMFNCRLTFPPLTADVLLVYLSFRHRGESPCWLPFDCLFNRITRPVSWEDITKFWCRIDTRSIILHSFLLYSCPSVREKCSRPGSTTNERDKERNKKTSCNERLDKAIEQRNPSCDQYVELFVEQQAQDLLDSGCFCRGQHGFYLKTLLSWVTLFLSLVTLKLILSFTYFHIHYSRCSTALVWFFSVWHKNK